jgi:hypothetical protein
MSTLADAVAALVSPRRTRVLVEIRHGEGVTLEVRDATVRAVLDELLASVTPSGQGGGGGRGGGAAASLEAIDLLDRVRELVDLAMRDAGLAYRRDPRTCRCGWPAADCARMVGPVPPSGEPLRCCPDCWHAPARLPLADALTRLAVHPWPPEGGAQLASRLDRLTAQVGAFLAGDSAGVYVRDTRCPRCRVWDVREQIDGAWHRHPALHVDAAGGRYAGTLCTACRTWWARAQDEQLRQELDADAARMEHEGEYRQVS